MIIGRKEEIDKLNKLYDSNKAEFVAVYGRRRVGKTFLIDEVFKKRISFRHAGLSPVGETSKGLMRDQLRSFYDSLVKHGMKKTTKPKDWFDAFLMLEQFLEEIDDGSRQLIFLDELPWMDTPRSSFIKAFEGFWNNWGCHRENLMIVVCGSANSWIQDNLINNHGGLYNRLTYFIKLSPFTLNECEEFFASIKMNISKYDIVQSYMAVGGIPYYLNYFDNRKSIAQNIDSIYFSKNAVLEDEFNRLFDSIFVNPEYIKKIVRFLYKNNSGFTRKEILKELKTSDGSVITRSLKALIASDFIVKYVPFGFSKREEHYKLVDPFCLFYLHFVDEKKTNSETYWQDHLESQEVVVWRGYAFENVCFNHIHQIKKALGISGVSTSVSAWSKRKDNDEAGVQIDMLITRKDNVINMCEIKFYDKEFMTNEAYSRTLKARKQTLRESIPSKYTIQGTLITTYGLKFNAYSGEFIHCVTLEDLFS